MPPTKAWMQLYIFNISLYTPDVSYKSKEVMLNNVWDTYSEYLTSTEYYYTFICMACYKKIFLPVAADIFNV